MNINVIVAICAGSAGAIYFSIIPAFLKRKSFKVFIVEFIVSFIACTIIGLIISLFFAFFLDNRELILMT